MDERWHIDLNIIEQGDIYFFYKPKKGIGRTQGLADVGRFYFVLQPAQNQPPRYIVLGNKKMPGVYDGGETTWGFVQIVGGRGFEINDTQNVYRPKDASRPVGEGIYAIVLHRDHAHLLYTLELPKSIGPVQRAFELSREANYIFLERPIEQSPRSTDVPFSNFSPVATTDNLNRRGTEILLVGVGADIGRLGIRAEKENETLETADIVNKLKVNMRRHPVGSLISGEWI